LEWWEDEKILKRCHGNQTSNFNFSDSWKQIKSKCQKFKNCLQQRSLIRYFSWETRFNFLKNSLLSLRTTRTGIDEMKNHHDASQIANKKYAKIDFALFSFRCCIIYRTNGGISLVVKNLKLFPGIFLNHFEQLDT
jgi:hypothetical protein